MTEEIGIRMNMSEDFGTFCAEGGKAIQYLEQKIYPQINSGKNVTLDFDGVKNMNSSFANAMFSNIVRKLEGNITGRILIVNARENIQTSIKMGLYLGRESLNQ